MRLSVAHSSFVIALVGFLCAAPPARVAAQIARSDPQPSAYMRIYGAYIPDRLQWEDARWGFGIASRVTLNTRWGLDFGVSRFNASNRAITPVTFGATYGPNWNGRVRPWVEFGTGYYSVSSVTGNPGIGYDAYYVPYTIDGPPVRMTQGRPGGYFGVGVDFPLNDRLVVGTGVRAHGWSVNPLLDSSRGGTANPDGLIALQTGISFGF